MLVLGAFSLLLGLFLKFQCCRINAIAQAGWLGAIFKDMAQVSLTAAADHFVPAHKERVILLGFDGLFGNRLPIAGPTGAGIKFGIRTEQLLSAAHALIRTLVMVVPISTREGALGCFLAGDTKLLSGQLL